MSGIFWELLQQRRLAQTGIDANRAQRAAFDARREVSALEDQVERLSLGFRALWELVASRRA